MGRDWKALTEKHRARGSLVINLAIACESQLSSPTPTGKRGRPRKYSLDLITTLLTLKVMLRLPLRALQGLATALFAQAGLAASVPDYSLLSRRMPEIQGSLPPIPQETVWLVADGTGLKITGEGEWHVRQHGASKRRQWRKVTLLLDPATGVIHSMVNTLSDQAEITHLPELLAGQDLTGKTLIYDGAADSRNAYNEVASHGGILLCPPRRGARRWRQVSGQHPRNRYLRAIGFIGRDAWKKQAGYHRRSLAETCMHRLKSLTGPSLAFRSAVSQTKEILLRVLILNAFAQGRGSFA